MRITEKEFEEQYKPIQNNFKKENTIYFDTDGEQYAYLQHISNKHIWTWVEGENENSWLIPGNHYINRMSYVITEKAWNDENIEVDLNDHLTLGDAKYATIDFLDSIGIELTDEQEDALHDFYSQLI